MRLRHLHEAADLPRTRQRNGIDAALRHLVDRSNDVGVGGLRIVDVGKHGIDLGAPRRDGADQRAMVPVGIKLQAHAMSPEIDACEHLGDAFGCRLLRRYLRLQPDLAQRPAGFWAASKFSRSAEGCDEFLLEIDPPRDLYQAAQTFT